MTLGTKNMDADAATALALSMPEAVQSSHFGNADFRVRDRIFASMPKAGAMVLKLTTEQQEMLVEAEGAVFSALPNKWGEKGWTTVLLAALDEPTALSALWMAWGNVAPKALAKQAKLLRK